ncbi:MAG TPA: hypothetical protein VKK06_20135 [Terriglobia bacterium]|nr:hypothetical protein [Terriglobia bacterium]
MGLLASFRWGKMQAPFATFIETVVLPDHRIRLLFLVLALKLKGWDQLPSEADKPTKIIFSWKGDEPEWSPNESGTD